MISQKRTYYVDTVFVVILLLETVATAANDDEYILATALYGTDTQGRYLLIAGPLPPQVEDIIKTDMQSRMYPKPIVKVVTFFINTTQLPLNDDGRENILQEFKSYNNVLKAEFPKAESRKTLKNLSYYYVVEDRKKLLKEKGEANTTYEQQKSEDTQQLLKKIAGNTTVVNKTSHPDDYIPNDIYYAIEKKCANWADGCDAKTPSILDMSSNNFKIPFVYRQKLHNFKLNRSR